MKNYTDYLIEEYLEPSYIPGAIASVEDIDLSNCRMVDSDQINKFRNEVESSAVVEFSPDPDSPSVLTRVAAYVFVVKDTPDGKVFLAKQKKRRLPGGGYDVDKDNGSLINTVIRETFEETGVRIKDVKDVDCAYWHYEANTGFEYGWVRKHIANESDMHHGYYERYFIAKYAGEENPESAEEADRFGWYPISVAEKSVSINRVLYDKAKAAGYLEDTVSEDLELTEGKHLGPLSYGVAASTGNNGPGGKGSIEETAVEILVKILESQKIKATTPDLKSKFDTQKLGFDNQVPYVSLSREALSHIGLSRWPVGLILDGDKLSDRYKIRPINHAYNVLATPDISALKTIEIKTMAIYENVDDPSDKLYRVVLSKQHTNTGGSIFISKELFNVLYRYLQLNNAFNTPPKSKKYGSDRSWGEAQLYKEYDNGRKMQRHTVPFNQRNKTWKCTFRADYEGKTGVKLGQKNRNVYADQLKDEFGIDISSDKFVVDLLNQGQVSESEERILLKKLLDPSEESEQYIDISGCILKIVIPEMYANYINSNFTVNKSKPRYLTAAEQEALQKLVILAGQLNCQIVSYDDMTTNKEIYDTV